MKHSKLMYYTRDGRPTDDYDDCHPTGDFDRDMRVAKTQAGGYTISTVFLGFDHQFGDGPPLIFETMVFGDGPLDNECDRYPTEADAVEGHAKMVERCRTVQRFALADPSLTGDGK